jgi:hypothetical protein
MGCWWHYLGLLDGEAHSPSTREVATALEGVARLAYQFARELFTLELRVGDEKEKRFNTANEAAADILTKVEERFNTANEAAADIVTKVTVKPEGRPVLDAAIRANEILARVAVREAKKLGEKSKKGRPTRGGATCRSRKFNPVGFARWDRISASSDAMVAIIHLLATFIADVFKSRRRLEVENLFLRHQLNIAVLPENHIRT